MRQLNRLENNRLKILTENSVEAALIEPTATSLRKSIMDATGNVRIYLNKENIHDYMIQKQGQENKVLIKASFITSDSIIRTIASLYRPNTKKGDPRIWFKGLTKYANPNDILAIIVYQNELYVLNLTTLDLEELINRRDNNPLKELLLEINRTTQYVAVELLNKLKKIASRGLIPAILQADTAVGRTLETLLGIQINSSTRPDYKGIELKSFRGNRGNRRNLFAQVPNWELSKFKSSAEILDTFGYQRDDDFKLYCTVSTLVPNSQGLKLKIDSDLKALYENSDKEWINDFVVWELDKLHERLLEKHNETFWITTESHIIEGQEYFLYKSVEHTKKPLVSQFDILLEQGKITLDHLIKRTKSGKVVEKGPLFKINPSALNLLFPSSQVYELL